MSSEESSEEFLLPKEEKPETNPFLSSEKDVSPLIDLTSPEDVSVKKPATSGEEGTGLGIFPTGEEIKEPIFETPVVPTEEGTGFGKSQKEEVRKKGTRKERSPYYRPLEYEGEGRKSSVPRERFSAPSSEFEEYIENRRRKYEKVNKENTASLLVVKIMVVVLNIILIAMLAIDEKNLQIILTVAAVLANFFFSIYLMRNYNVNNMKIALFLFPFIASAIIFVIFKLRESKTAEIIKYFVMILSVAFIYVLISSGEDKYIEIQKKFYGDIRAYIERKNLEEQLRDIKVKTRKNGTLYNLIENIEGEKKYHILAVTTARNKNVTNLLDDNYIWNKLTMIGELEKFQ